MDYTKTIWKDLPDTSTPITASNLNNMENGIEWLFQNNNGAPIGTVMMFAGDTAPSGFKICDGSVLSRTTYADLFSVIGTAFGTGDGTTTFNLPNLQSRIPVGLDNNDTDFNTLGATGGEKEHTLTVAEMPSHQHTLQNANSGGSSVPWSSYGVAATSNIGYYDNVKTDIKGNSQPHNIMQPYLVLNYIIKVS